MKPKSSRRILKAKQSVSTVGTNSSLKSLLDTPGSGVHIVTGRSLVSKPRASDRARLTSNVYLAMGTSGELHPKVLIASIAEHLHLLGATPKLHIACYPDIPELTDPILLTFLKTAHDEGRILVLSRYRARNPIKIFGRAFFLHHNHAHLDSMRRHVAMSRGKKTIFYKADPNYVHWQ